MILTDFGCCYDFECCYVTQTPTKTECLIFPYEQIPFKKYSLDSIKICSLSISSRTALRIADSRKLSAKKHNFKVYANNNYVQCKLTPHWTVVLAKPLYHDSFQLCRKRLFALQGDMTLEDRNTVSSCMIHSDRPGEINKLPTISASIVITIS